MALEDDSHSVNDYSKAWDALCNTIGAAKGQSAGYFDDVEHLTVDQRLKVAEIAALLSIAQEVNHLRHDIGNSDDDNPNHVYL